MKLINSSFEILEESSGINEIHKMIEIAGRTCYKSEDKITEDSAKDFVNRMIKSGHGAMLEHGTVYLKDINNPYYLYDRYKQNPYSKVELRTLDYSDPGHPIKEYYISTNFRVLVENDWLDDIQYLCEPTEHHERRISVRFICDRGVSHEFVRHKLLCVA